MSRAAIRYAKAILDNAISSNKAEMVNNDMKLIVSTITGNKELKTFLESPVVKQHFKQAAVEEIFSGVEKDTKSLFQLLAENARFEILSKVASQYSILYDNNIGVETAYVTTAFPINSEIEAKVLAKVAEFSDKKIKIKNKIDESIIGGFVLRVGDKQYNASVAYRLNELKREFIK